MPSCKRIILVLDSSGSMASQKSDIIGGINETIRQQRKTAPEENDSVFFNIVKFSSYVTEPTNNSLADIPFITERDYNPTGSTALFDAMGKTMDKYRDEHEVIMIVATDGEENASNTYTYKLITDMVRDFKEKKGWNFIYLSEDIDTFKQGNSIGIRHDAYACNNLAVGKGNIGSTMSSAFNQQCISEMRKGNKNVKMRSVSKSSQGIQPSIRSQNTYNPTISSLSGQQIPRPSSNSRGWW